MAHRLLNEIVKTLADDSHQVVEEKGRWKELAFQPNQDDFSCKLGLI